MKIIKTFPYAKYLQMSIDLACEHGTPEIVVASAVTEHLGIQGNIFNISGSAVRNFSLTDDCLSFDCSVGGNPLHVSIHPTQVIAVNVREAEGYCLFPMAHTDSVQFVCKSQAGETYARAHQETILKGLSEEPSAAQEENVKEQEEGSSNVVSLSSRRKKD